MTEIEEIKARLDIVDIVGQYVPLQRAGRSFKALCPFHTEKTPSFIVTPDRQSWHCFGACGTGGDAFSFVMRKEGIEFPEALRMLAARAGVTLREQRRSPEEEQRRQRIYAANEAAARWFHELLVSGEAGREAWGYTQGRGIDRTTAEAFLLGYSLPSWEATRDALRQRGFTEEEQMAAGLLVEGERGPHDRFRARLMFPIRDSRGRFVGFGARALDESMPKYLNTTQTTVFDKGGMLYALERAQDGIRREGCGVVVEGYMDVIAAHQMGFDNVVATMGTSLTERQVRLLKRHTRSVVLALDADAAGSEAALRGHEVLQSALRQEEQAETVPLVTWRGLVRYQDTASVDLRVAVLPEGDDPDDVIRADPEAWRQFVASARPVLDYRFETASSRHDMSSPKGRSEAVQELLPLLEAVTDPVVRAHYLQRLSRLSLVKEEQLARMVGSKRRQKAESTAAPPSLLNKRGDNRREEFLLTLLMRFPHLRDAGVDIRPELVWESANRELLEAWKRSPQLDTVKETFPEELKAHLERLQIGDLPDFSPAEAEAALKDCLRGLDRRKHTMEAQASAALLAEKEEELGASVLAEAASSDRAPDDERIREGIDILRTAQESGMKIHTKERKGEGGQTAESTING